MHKNIFSHTDGPMQERETTTNQEDAPPLFSAQPVGKRIRQGGQAETIRFFVFVRH